jgi:hypothetical protein
VSSQLQGALITNRNAVNTERQPAPLAQWISAPRFYREGSRFESGAARDLRMTPHLAYSRLRQLTDNSRPRRLDGPGRRPLKALTPVRIRSGLRLRWAACGCPSQAPAIRPVAVRSSGPHPGQAGSTAPGTGPMVLKEQVTGLSSLGWGFESPWGHCGGCSVNQPGSLPR